MIDCTPKRNSNFIDKFNELIDKSVEHERSQQTPRDYLGGSRLGAHCERQLGYEWHKTPKDEGADFNGRIYRIFDRGHDGEERVVEYLKYAGFELEEEKPGGGQWGFAVAKDEDGVPRLRGHADGIIRGGPDKIGNFDMAGRYPMLWENKIINEKRYKQLMKTQSARESEWEYYVQCQVYMAYLGLDWALFTAISANTMHIYAEVMPLDPEVAQAASDKGVRVVKSAAPEELARCAAKETDFRCRWCSYKERCWSVEEEPAIQTESTDLDWLTRNWK